MSRTRGVVAFLTIVLCSGVLSSATAWAQLSGQANPICERADRLTSKATPQQSIALLERSSAVTTCPQEWLDAQRAVEYSRELARQAQTWAELGDSRRAVNAADEALRRDSENAAATTVKEAESGSAWPGAVAKGFATWQESYLDPLAKLLPTMLALLAALLVLARVLPIVVKRVRKPDAKPSLRGIALGLGVMACLAASALLTIAVSGGAKYFPPHRDMSPVAAIVAGGVAAALGVALVGWWLASRLRLEIIATDEEGGRDMATAAHIGALLSDLGASPPRGLEIPDGADTTALEGALSAIPGAGALIEKLGKFLSGIMGFTPWRAEVAVVEGDALAVRMVRNGHPMGSTVIGRDDGRLVTGKQEVPPIDRQRMAAAYILMTLHAEHPMAGLGGTTDWRSLGLHYIATSDPDLRKPENDGTQRATLREALDLDPDNKLARLSWQHNKWRTSTDPDELESYQTWLATAFPARPNKKPDDGLDALRLRAAYTRAAICLNWYAAAVLAEKDTTARDRAESAMRRARLAHIIGDLNRGPDQGFGNLRTRMVNLAESMKSEWPISAASSAELKSLSEECSTLAKSLDQDSNEASRQATAMLLDSLQALDRESENQPSSKRAADAYAAAVATFEDLLDARTPSEDLKGLTTVMRELFNAMPETVAQLATWPPGQDCFGTNAIYNRACWFAMVKGSDDAAHEAVRLLQRVWAVEGVANWMPKDPMLDDLRTTPAYRNAFLTDARTDFFELPPVAPHAERLKAAGYGTAQALNEAASPLTSQLSVLLPWTQRQPVLDLAGFYTSLVGSDPLRAAAVEILFELCDRNLTTRAALALVADRAAVIGKIAEGIDKRCRPKTLGDCSAQAIQEWWAQTLTDGG